MEEMTRWSLREMFPTDDDWKQTMEEALKLANALAGRRGHLAETPQGLLETARLYLDMEEKLYRLMVFANSNFDQNMADPEAKKLYEIAQNQATSIGEKLSFMAPELMEHSLEEFLQWCQEEPDLKLYETYARDFFDRK